MENKLTSGELFDIQYFNKIVPDKALSNIGKEIVEETYDVKERIQVTVMLYDNTKDLGIKISPTKNSLQLIGDYVKSNEIHVKDKIYKDILLETVKDLISKFPFHEYLFMSEMWFKQMPVKSEKEYEEKIKNYKQGDLGKDLESQEGVIIHYETKTSYSSSTYAIRRKYEKGKILEVLNTMDHMIDPKLRGNLCNILYTNPE